MCAHTAADICLLRPVEPFSILAHFEERFCQKKKWHFVGETFMMGTSSNARQLPPSSGSSGHSKVEKILCELS